MKFFNKDKWVKQINNSDSAHHINLRLTRTGEDISEIFAHLMINIILTCIILSVFILADYIGLSLTSFEYQLLVTAEIFLIINYIIIMSQKAWRGSIRIFNLITHNNHNKTGKNKNHNKTLATVSNGIKSGWFFVQAVSFLVVMILFIMSIIRFW